MARMIVRPRLGPAPKLSCNSRVKHELRYLWYFGAGGVSYRSKAARHNKLTHGIWADLRSSASRTSPRALRLLLMCFASVRRSPAAPLLLKRSLPARSTRLKRPTVQASVPPCAELKGDSVSIGNMDAQAEVRAPGSHFYFENGM